MENKTKQELIGDAAQALYEGCKAAQKAHYGDGFKLPEWVLKAIDEAVDLAENGPPVPADEEKEDLLSEEDLARINKEMKEEKEAKERAERLKARAQQEEKAPAPDKKKKMHD